MPILSASPNISFAEHTKSSSFYYKQLKAIELLELAGHQELADQLAEDEIFQFHKARSTYNIRKDKSEKVPEARSPCELCNTMVLKRGLKEHRNNKKCRAIQKENLMCAKTTSQMLRDHELVAGETETVIDEETGEAMPINMTGKWAFDTSAIGEKKKAEYDKMRKEIKDRIKAEKKLANSVVVPVVPEIAISTEVSVPETENIPKKEIIKIKRKKVTLKVVPDE